MLVLLFQEECNHKIKVTHLKGVGWGVRLFTNGTLNQEGIASTRKEIGPLCRSMLRIEDKCGNWSKYASSSRHRQKSLY